jgi:hypothetical protein
MLEIGFLRTVRWGRTGVFTRRGLLHRGSQRFMEKKMAGFYQRRWLYFQIQYRYVIDMRYDDKGSYAEGANLYRNSPIFNALATASDFELTCSLV